MDVEYGRVYRQLHETHWWWRFRESLVLAQLRRLCPAAGFGPILDVGCGDGLFLEALEELGAPEGLEAEAAIVSADSRRRWPFHLCPFDEGFQPGKEYGLILMLDVLEHLADDAAALRQARRLLAVGGILLVTVPAFRALWTTHDDLNHHRRRYTKSALTGVAEQAGIRVEAARYFFHWLFLVKLLVRLGERLRRAEPSPPRLPGASVNRLCHRLCRVDEAVLGRLPVPFGSSVLLLGSRSG